jgi:hypothetical protein
MAEDSTQPPQATRFIETTRGVLSYTQLARYLRALRAADAMDWKPLAEVWRERLEKE